MDQINHKHNWRVFTNADYVNGKEYRAMFKCDGCDLRLHASDAIQLELWKQAIGWRSWLSLIALVISFIALFVSFLK